MVMVDNICAVEKLDYGALGKSNMGQIIHRSSDESSAIIYFQAKVRFNSMGTDKDLTRPVSPVFH